MLVVIFIEIKCVLYTGKYSNQTLVLCAEGANIASCYREIYGKRVVLTSKKLNILMRDQHFSTAALSEMELSNVEREGSGGKYPPLLLKLG